MRWLVFLVAATLGACGSSSLGDDDGGNAGSDGAPGVDASTGGADAKPSVPQYAELWYSVDNLLVYIELDPANGSVVGFPRATSATLRRWGKT